MDKTVSVKAWQHAHCIKTWFILGQSSRVDRQTCNNSLNSNPKESLSDINRDREKCECWSFEWPQRLPLLVKNDDAIYSPREAIHVCISDSCDTDSDTHPAFHNTLVRFTGDINLIHSTPQVVKEKSPVAGTQIHLAGLPGFRGTLLCPLVQQTSKCTFVFHAHILWRQAQYNRNEQQTKTTSIAYVHLKTVRWNSSYIMTSGSKKRCCCHKRRMHPYTVYHPIPQQSPRTLMQSIICRFCMIKQEHVMDMDLNISGI